MLVVCTFSPYRVTKNLLEDVVAPACKTHTPRGAQIEQPTYCFVVDSLAPHMGKKGGQSSGASLVSATFLGGFLSPQRCIYIVCAQALLTPPMSTSLVFAGHRWMVLASGSICVSGPILVTGLGMGSRSGILMISSPVTNECDRIGFKHS